MHKSSFTVAVISHEERTCLRTAHKVCLAGTFHIAKLSFCCCIRPANNWDYNSVSKRWRFLATWW